jgi:hypothetical protein
MCPFICIWIWEWIELLIDWIIAVGYRHEICTVNVKPVVQQDLHLGYFFIWTPYLVFRIYEVIFKITKVFTVSFIFRYAFFLITLCPVCGKCTYFYAIPVCRLHTELGIVYRLCMQFWFHGDINCSNTRSIWDVFVPVSLTPESSVRFLESKTVAGSFYLKFLQ